MKKLLLFAALCAGVIAVSGAVYAHLHDDASAPKLTYWSDGAVKSSVVYVDGWREGTSGIRRASANAAAPTATARARARGFSGTKTARSTRNAAANTGKASASPCWGTRRRVLRCFESPRWAERPDS
jgi:hypothetical protein